ncbi:MAG: glycoside hydrolase family 2 protein [Oscillospiraceae bacterium]|nr:glycoside hydrolase family 2 protein [Oscillospiraceae bacterium]
MRNYVLLDGQWQFTHPNGTCTTVTLPHTWNALDGQDGGNNYCRGTGIYEKAFSCPAFDPETQCVYLEFRGVNASAKVTLNGEEAMRHDGGYSTFRVDVTQLLQEENLLRVEADNSVNNKVYPQKADFTFYGGIYRDVLLVVANRKHFDMDYFGGSGLAVNPIVSGSDGKIHVRTWHNAPGAQVQVRLTDADGKPVAEGQGTDITLTVEDVHLWNGMHDPYLYMCEATLMADGIVCDRVSTAFGVRSFHMDPKRGFFLNGRPYPLHGVSRHQDRKGIGNALTKEHHDEDMALIRELGANTVRLAHYQHDQYFYDLCDRYGIIVWAEIPYISAHMPDGNENTVSQMQELIVQNYNHPSIVTWGISNEITISGKHRRDMLQNHYMLNQLVHDMDPGRPTVLACYAVCGPFNKVAHITDIVSWNLYLGWYVPGLFLNDLWIDFFHKMFPKRCLGFSEYGCEGMPNLHSAHPHRGDHTEEYQAIYHEYMLECFRKRPFMWANHVWNMFDFAADARDQGGEPGMNHKGLVTFDRKTKKDSFYLYKAHWNPEPMLHIAGKRYVNRAEKVTTVKVYTNVESFTLYANGKEVGSGFSKRAGGKVFTFRVPMEETLVLEAVCGELRDTATLHGVSKPDPAYKLSKKKAGGGNWV